MYYLGEICFGFTDDKIIIEYGKNSKITVTVNEFGKISPWHGTGTIYGYGQFEEANKVTIVNSIGGLGGGNVYNINGTKKGRRQL